MANMLSPFFRSKSTVIPSPSSSPTPSPSLSLSSGDPIKSGYLNKQGGSIKSWKKRWFVLYADYLSYSESRKDFKEVDRIPLSPHITVKEDIPRNQLSITNNNINSNNGGSVKVYVLQAESQEDMNAWVLAIRGAVTTIEANARPKETTNATTTEATPASPDVKTDSPKVPKHDPDSSTDTSSPNNPNSPTHPVKAHEYDVVFDISSISQLPHTPWPVLLSSDKYGLFNKRPLSESADPSTPSLSSMRGSIVSVVGLYNKGKTLVINNLSDEMLPSGAKVTTRGLSFVCPSAFAGSMVFLDTAGTHSPVQVHSEDALLDRRATELLVQDLVFDLADYFLVVVQDLTWPDQEFIQGLVLKLNASQKHFKQVIVIHNFRDTEDVQDALDHWKLQVVNSYPMGEQILRPVTLNDKRTVNAIFYASKAVRHVFIAKEGSNAGREFNAATFQLLKSWLYDIVVEAGKELRPMDKVLQSVNNHVKNYIDEGCKSVKYKYKDDQVFMELEDSNFADFKLRPFTLGWISPKFETGEFTPSIDTWSGSEGWICTMDVPGVTATSVKVITRNWPILRIEGERNAVVFEDYKLERSERKFSPFSATMKVHPSLDPRSKHVEVVDGVLTLKFKYYDDLDSQDI